MAYPGILSDVLECAFEAVEDVRSDAQAELSLDVQHDILKAEACLRSEPVLCHSDAAGGTTRPQGGAHLFHYRCPVEQLPAVGLRKTFG